MSTSTPLNVATYLRVSTEEQTVEPQRLELADYCTRQGWTVVGEWSDIMSGAKAARPGLDALLARVEGGGGVEAIVTVRLDRIGRSVLNVAALCERLDAAGVGLICTAQGIDTRKSNPAGSLLRNLMAAFAEFERATIRERTKEGLVAARARGKVLGRRSKKLVPEDGQKAAVAQWETTLRHGGLRALAWSLGGVSPMTAQKIARKWAGAAQAAV